MTLIKKASPTDMQHDGAVENVLEHKYSNSSSNVQTRSLKIATAKTAKTKSWENIEIPFDQLAKQLESPKVVSCTLKEYLALPKEKQRDVKDVGGYVGGYLKDGRRKPDNVACRTLLTLDLDTNVAADLPERVKATGVSAIVHSTFKSTEETPRYRIIVELDKEVPGTAYEAIARRYAEKIGLEMFDPTTFEIHRLMYWPAKPADTEYFFKVFDSKPLDTEAYLETYRDYTDVSEWPSIREEKNKISEAAKKQQDPTEKSGIIGAFCRTYTITEAIEKFLSDVYAPCDTEDRYTYRLGEASAGLIVYEDKFAYSHHGTDPAGGQLCNAFDLVRIHKFGGQDIGSSKAIHLQPSYKSMCRVAELDDAVQRTIAQELEQAAHREGATFCEIGCDLFRVKESGELQPWDWSVLRRKYGKNAEQIVKEYPDGFVNIPSFTNYEQYPNGTSYNLSKRPPQYDRIKDNFPTILGFLEHLCSESWDVRHLLDYLQIALLYPCQKLQILVLVSEAQSTGKTSFLNLLSWIFANTVICTIDDLAGRFNSHWVGAAFIGLEESVSEKRSQAETLKRLSTTQTVLYEKKGVDTVIVQFNAKFVLCNNQPANPIYADHHDNRYTVLKVPTLKEHNPNFETDVKGEIEAFREYLINRTLHNPVPCGRMWFSDEVINTEATKQAKQASIPISETTLNELVAAIREKHGDVEILLTLNDLKMWWAEFGVLFEQQKVLAALKRRSSRVSRRGVTVYLPDEMAKRSPPAYYYLLE